MKTSDHVFDDWMKWFTTDEGKTPCVFRLPNGMRAATNGYIAVVMVEEGDTGEIKSDKIAGSIVGFLSLPKEKSVTLSREKIIEAFGKCDHPKMVKCMECTGTKRMTHRCDCKFCGVEHEECDYCENGMMEEIPENRYVSMFGNPFDANKLAYIIEHTPAADRYEVSMCKHAKTWQAHIVSDKCHAVLVALTDNAKEDENGCPEVMEQLV